MDPIITARKIWSASTGRGLGYELQPLGPQLDLTAVRGYFVDLTAKTDAPSAARAEFLPPAALAQLALGWWERSLAGDARARERFEAICGLLTQRAQVCPDGLRWSYSMAVPKYRVHPPWFSAMAQGQVASVFVRAFVATGDERWREAALEATRPLLAERETDIVAFTGKGPVLEEAPGEPRGHVLNGWIYALWGLWDVAMGLEDAAARARFEESTACLAAMLDRYDVGYWTRYSLYPHRIADLAKPFYHRLHTTQATVMYRLTGRHEFEQAAVRWKRYDEPLRRTFALAQKSLFVVAVRAFDR